MMASWRCEVAGEQLSYEEGTKQRPHQEGARQSEGLGELDRFCQPPSGGGPEQDATGERGDEAVPADRHGPLVGQQRQGEDSDLVGHRRGPATVIGQGQQLPANIADHDRSHDGQPDLGERFQPPCRLAEPFLGGHDSDEEGDQWRRDAIVEPALDIQRSSDPRRNGLVGDHRQPQRRVGGRQDGGDQCCRRPPDLGKHQVCQQRARNDRERQPDEQQPAGHTGIAFDIPQPDRGGIGEQQQGQGQLGDGEDRLVGQREGEHI